jgi:hypothetical protein
LFRISRRKTDFELKKLEYGADEKGTTDYSRRVLQRHPKRRVEQRFSPVPTRRVARPNQ